MLYLYPANLLIKPNLLDLELEPHSKMKKILSLFIFIFLNLSPTIAYGKIVYIDINLILNKSEIGKSLKHIPALVILVSRQ